MKTYWSSEGKYQKLSEIFQFFIPRSGEADKHHFNILRLVNNVYYDVYNNGGWNDRHTALGDALTADSINGIEKHLKNKDNLDKIAYDGSKNVRTLEAVANAVILYVKDAICDAHYSVLEDWGYNVDEDGYQSKVSEEDWQALLKFVVINHQRVVFIDAKSSIEKFEGMRKSNPDLFGDADKSFDEQLGIWDNGNSFDLKLQSNSWKDIRESKAKVKA